jgi:predicted nucleic acid-binding protein
MANWVVVDTDILIDAGRGITATSITLNLPLITKNQRDYRFIAGLQLLPYPPSS